MTTQPSLFGLLHNGTQTSRDAAVSNKDRAPSQRERVLAAIQRHDLTNEEIGDYVGIPIQSVCPRVFELRGLGKIEDSGKRRPTKAGQMATVWRVK